MTESTKTAAQSAIPTRLPWVDVLRGVAVLFVLFRHMHLATPKPDAGLLYRGLFFLQTGGGVGVDLFFVISGFLVSGILFRQYVKTGQIRPWQFLIRRGFKIYPPFWVFIAVTMVVIWVNQGQLPLKNALVELLFVQNYLSGLYAHTWSLGVEEHCYLGLCLLLTALAVLNRKLPNPFRTVPAFAVVLGLTALVLRSSDASAITPKTFLQRITPTHLRCDTFLMGCMLGYFYYFSNGAFLRLCQRFRAILLVVGAAGLLPLFLIENETATKVTTWLYWCAGPAGALLLMGALGSSAKPGLLSRSIAVVGRHSYSIYLWHILIGVRFLDFAFAKLNLPPSILTWVPLYLMLSIGSGIVMSYLVEIPSLKLRDRWFPDSAPEQGKPAAVASVVPSPHADFVPQAVDGDIRATK